MRNMCIKIDYVHLYMFITSYLLIFRSNHKCNLVLNSGYLHTSTCEESHVFKPLTTGSGENTHGAKTIVTQTLKYKGSSSGVKTPLTGNLNPSLVEA